MEPTAQSPLTAEEYQSLQDKQQLDMLVVLWYVNMVFGLMPGCIGALYMSMGSIFVMAPVKGPAAKEAFVPFAIFGGLGLVLMFVSMILLGLSFFTARSIRERRNHTFVSIVAGLNCLNAPLGTALGVFTFVVTQRPSVKALFR